MLVFCLAIVLQVGTMAWTQGLKHESSVIFISFLSREYIWEMSWFSSRSQIFADSFASSQYCSSGGKDGGNDVLCKHMIGG